jgi:phage recombination protein Bet
MSAVARVEDLTPDRVALLKRTLCPELTNDEMELLAGVARRAGLDPFAKQIYGIKRKGKLTIQTGIDGFRVIAARSGELDGQEGPFWCGMDGVWKDVWVERDPPAAAKVIVYRKGCRFGFTGIARFTEYAQVYNGSLTDMWARMGANQIAKCAEALALRKAFPADLSGLYTAEEMEQAGEPDAVAQQQPVEVKQIPAKQDVAKPASRYAKHSKAVTSAKSLDALKTAMDAVNADVKANRLTPDEIANLTAAKDARKTDLAKLAELAKQSVEGPALPDFSEKGDTK